MRQAVAGSVRPTGERTKADLMARKGPALGRASRLSVQRASGLGGAATLIGIALSLNGPSRLISNPHRQLGNALVGVDHLLQSVPHDVALNRHKVLHRAGADNPVHSLDVLLQAILHEA